MAPFNSMMLPLLVVASERTGASARQALPVALIAMMAKSPVFAVVTAIALTRANQPSNSSTATVTPTPTPGSGSGAPGVSPLVTTFGIPSFIGMTRKQAHAFAKLLGLRIDHEFPDEPRGHVVRQDPEVGDRLRGSDNTVALTYPDAIDV